MGDVGTLSLYSIYLDIGGRPLVLQFLILSVIMGNLRDVRAERAQLHLTSLTCKRGTSLNT